MLLALASISCTGQSLYTTPRTVGDDRTQWIAAPQIELTTLKNPPKRCTIRQLEEDAREFRADGCSNTNNIGHAVPTAQFTHRIGVSERVEVGIFFPAGIGADLKWHAIHAGPFDLALIPRASFALFTLRRNRPPDQYYGFSGIVMQAPILASLTAGPIAFVVSPGPVEVFDFDGGITHGLRMGFGIQWKILDHFALHPEASLMEEYAGPAELNSVVLGIGIIWKHVAWPD